MEFVTNNNGIRFLICCASCENRVLEVTGSRCGLVRAKPKPGKQCTTYRFRQSLMDAEKKKAELRNPIISAFCWSGETERQCAVRTATEPSKPAGDTQRVRKDVWQYLFNPVSYAGFI